MEVGVTCLLLRAESRVEKGLAERERGPKRAIRGGEDSRGGLRPIGVNIGPSARTMEPLTWAVAGGGAVGKEAVGAAGTVGLGFWLQTAAHNTDTDGEVRLGTIARFDDVVVPPFGVKSFGGAEPATPKHDVGETGESQVPFLQGVCGREVPGVEKLINVANVTVEQRHRGA